MLIYKLFGLIDWVVYSTASYLFGLIMDLANFNMFDNNVISDFSTKIYGILGVIMVFKVILSAIQYLLSPDKINDKEMGAGGLLKNLAVTIILLIFLPDIFSFAKNMQSKIVELLPEFILGVKIGNVTDNNTTSAKDIGDKLAFNTLKAFVTLKNGTVDNIKNFDQFRDNIDKDCMPNGGWIWDKFEYLFSSEKCYYEYRVIIPTIAGAFMVYILLGMVIDVGIRAVKFGLLEIIAPIPVACYFDKKSRTHFDAWLKSCKDVYLDLFIRLGIIYFVIYILSVVNFSTLFNQDGTTAGTPGWLLGTAIVFAILAFAKDAPKFITGMLGLKDTGSMKDVFQPFWKKGGGAAGALLNPARNAIGNAANAWANTKGTAMTNQGEGITKLLKQAAHGTHRIANAARHGAAGALTGAAEGLMGAAKGETWSQMNKRLTNSVDASSKRSSKEGIRMLDKNETKDARIEANMARDKIVQAKHDQQVLADEQKDLDNRLLATHGSAIDEKLKEIKKTASDAFSENKTLTAERTRLQADFDSIDEKLNPAAKAAKKKELDDNAAKIAANNAKIAAYGKIREAQDQKAVITKNYDDQIAAISASDPNRATKVADLQKQKADALQKATKYEDLRLEMAREMSKKASAESELKTRVANYDTEIARQKSIMESTTDPIDYETAQKAYASLITERAKVADEKGGIKPDALRETQQAMVDADIKEYNDKVKAQQTIIDQAAAEIKFKTQNAATIDLEHPEEFEANEVIHRNITRSAAVKAAFEERILMKKGVTAQSYSDLSSTITSARKEWWSGEAMTKLKQNPGILEVSAESAGEPATKFKPSQKAVALGHKAEDFKFTFSEITELKTRVDRDPQQLEVINAERRAQGKVEFASVAEISEGIYNEVLKYAAVEYVDRVDNDQLVGGNTGMKEAIKRFRASMAGSRCPETSGYDYGHRTKDENGNVIKAGLGTFLMTGADTGAALTTKAARMSSYNSGKKDNK